MQKINKITQPFPEILAICYFMELCVCHTIQTCSFHATNKITQPYPEILALCYFGEYWICMGMPDQTQQILYDLNKASMDI